MLRSYPATFIKLSPLFIEIWSFKTIHSHYLNFKTQRQKRYDITNGAKVNFIVWGL